MAQSIFIACNGDIKKAIEHEKMPYKRKSTVSRLAKEYGWYEDTGIPKPKPRGLSEEEIEKIRNAFIETNGHIIKTAQYTGFAKSTVSRYAKSRNWHEELLQINKKLLNKSSNNNIACLDDKQLSKTQDDNKEIIAKLKALRQILLNEIVNDKNLELDEISCLKIHPKTLSEAVKALIDIDKRISELEGTQYSTISDMYQNIIENCGEISKYPED